MMLDVQTFSREAGPGPGSQGTNIMPHQSFRPWQATVPGAWVKVISSTALKYRYLWCARSETPGQISQLIVLTRGKSFDTTAP